MSSVTISFTTALPTGGGKDVVIELDDEKNNGKTTFRYGEKAYFKIFYDPALNVVVDKTDGILTDEGQGQETVEEFVSFIDSKEATLNKPCLNILSVEWLGNSLGSITQQGLYSIITEKTPELGGSNGIGLAKIEYTTQFKRYAISIPEKNVDEYQVIVAATSR